MATGQTPRQPPGGINPKGFMDARHRAGNVEKNLGK